MRCDVCGERTTSKHGVCTRNAECKRELKRRWNEAHQEHNREYQRNWYETNQESVRESQRQAHKNAAHDELTYLIWSPGLKLHKIGFTVNLTNRFRTLRNGCPDIHLVTTFPHGRKLERWLHDRFRVSRIESTEWYSGVTEVDVKNAVVEYESKRGLA